MNARVRCPSAVLDLSGNRVKPINARDVNPSDALIR
jgi:hypothetical protein